MSVGQKLAMLKNHSLSITFLSLRNLEAAPEETMQLRRLIRAHMKAYDYICLGKWSFRIFRVPQLRPPPPALYSTSKIPHLIGLKSPLTRREFL
jgi:hypothetical protein